MAIDEGLAERIREALGTARTTEKKMFGGLAFMSRGHMFIGIAKEALMVRVGPAAYGDALQRPHAREMDFTGRPMKGYVSVDPAGFEGDDDLSYWVQAGLTFVATLLAKLAGRGCHGGSAQLLRAFHLHSSRLRGPTSRGRGAPQRVSRRRVGACGVAVPAEYSRNGD